MCFDFCSTDVSLPILICALPALFNPGTPHRDHTITRMDDRKCRLILAAPFFRVRSVRAARITATVEIHRSELYFLRRSRAVNHPDLSHQSESRGKSPIDSDHRDSSRCLTRALAPQVCDTLLLRADVTRLDSLGNSTPS